MYPWPHPTASWPTTTTSTPTASSWPPTSHTGSTTSFSTNSMPWSTPPISSNPPQALPHAVHLHDNFQNQPNPLPTTAPSSGTMEHFFGQPSLLHSPWHSVTSSTSPTSQTFPATCPTPAVHHVVPTAHAVYLFIRILVQYHALNVDLPVHQHSHCQHRHHPHHFRAHQWHPDLLPPILSPTFVNLLNMHFRLHHHRLQLCQSLLPLPLHLILSPLRLPNTRQSRLPLDAQTRPAPRSSARRSTSCQITTGSSPSRTHYVGQYHSWTCRISSLDPTTTNHSPITAASTTSVDFGYNHSFNTYSHRSSTSIYHQTNSAIHQDSVTYITSRGHTSTLSPIQISSPFPFSPITPSPT